MNNIRLKNLLFLSILNLSFLFTIVPQTYAQRIRVANTAQYVGSGRYNWTVFLIADESTLNTISYVEYILHPSFSNPTRRVYNRESNFALSSSGWGEFNIMVKIVYKDGRITYLQHWLRLEESKGEEPQINPAPPHYHGRVTAGNTSRYVGRSRWDWTVFIVADDETLDEIKCVEYTLHPTFPDPIRMICNRGSASGKGFFLNSNGWGTFSIGVKVVFKDGDIKYLKHKLSFSGNRK
jgi:transcription initiation factor IIF auxiliary subunit